MQDECLHCQNLTFHYRRGATVLDGFSHSFRPGVTLLKGYSGCGKSTLLKLAAGYLKPQRGRVTVPGGGGPRSGKFQRERLGFVFQQLNLLPLASLQRNLDLVGALAGLPGKVIRERRERYLELLGLSELRHRLPSSLSGGQQQRAALARALIREPAVFLLDEPTSGLDDLNCQVIIRLLCEFLPASCVCLVATHDQRLDELSQDAVDFNRFLPVEPRLRELAEQ